jgi:hypothetical protein
LDAAEIMRRFLFLLAFFFNTNFVFAAETSPTSGEPADYIPKDVTDAVRVLKPGLTKDEIADIENPSRSNDSPYNNFFLEEGMRNSWGLWRKSRLQQWFTARGVLAPEDMSDIIFQATQADLNHRLFNIQQALLQTHEGEQEALASSKEIEKQGLKSAAKIKRLMLGLQIEGKPAQVVTLPPRSTSAGIRVRLLAPFAGGFLLTDKHDDEKDVWASPYFLDLAKESVRPIQIAGMTRIENAIVLGGTAYFEGTNASHEVLIAFDGKSSRSLDLPPDSGTLRLGQDGGQLLAVRPRTIYRRDGDRWTLIVRMHDIIPLALVPPTRVGDRIYLRDEGHEEDDKRLWWIDLVSGHIASFDKDCGVVGPEGPRWENVWSYTVEPSGRLWLAPGYSLVRWDRDGGYRVAVMNGKPAFDGQLIAGLAPDTSNMGAGWTMASNGEERQTQMAATGLTLLPEGTLDVIGPSGLYRVAGDKIMPLLAFRNTLQDIPKSKNDDGMHWQFDPTHFLPLEHRAYLIGDHWAGVYLLAKDASGIYRFTALDEKIGPQITLDEITAR